MWERKENRWPTTDRKKRLETTFHVGVVNMQILTSRKKIIIKEHVIRIPGIRTSAMRQTPCRNQAEMSITMKATSRYGRIDA